MKGRRIAMLVSTGLVVLMMGSGGVLDVLRMPQVMEIIQRLGYPSYFPVMLGVAKILGVVALLAPVPRTVREWAYAGFTFDLIAAIVSHLAAGDPPQATVQAAVALGLVLTSYFLRREAPAAEPAPAAPVAPVA